MGSDFELLRQLSEAVAVSGDEGAVRKIVLAEIEGHADEIQVDAVGNVLARKTGRGRRRARTAKLKAMVAAHMDEVGFMVMGIGGDGTLIVEAVGSVDERQWLGKPVWVGANKTPGVIGAKPVHLMDAAESEKVVKLDALRVDIGASSLETAKSQVKIGDRGTFASSFTSLGPTIRGKALDDRLGCVTLIELLRGEPLAVDLYAAFTVQEEVGLRGAQVAAYAFDPDAAFALDVAPANDLPGSDGEENVTYNTRLGAGPAIYVADGRTLHSRPLVNHLIKTAEAAGIPYQLRQPGGGSTDAAAIQLAREGIPVAAVSTPGRYLHTAFALVNLEDWRNTVRLVREALNTLSLASLKTHFENRR